MPLYPPAPPMKPGTSNCTLKNQYPLTTDSVSFPVSMAFVGMREDTCDAIGAKILKLEEAIAEEKNEKEKEALRKNKEALRKKEEALRTTEIMQMKLQLQATSSSGKFYM